MEFVQIFTRKNIRKKEGGSLTIFNDSFTIRVGEKIKIKTVGLTKEGIGIITKPCPEKKVKVAVVKLTNLKKILPEEFTGNDYKFRIDGEKINESEYLFKFSNAKMINKK